MASKSRPEAKKLTPKQLRRLPLARRKRMVVEAVAKGQMLVTIRDGIGIYPTTVRRWRSADPAFAAAYDDAVEEAADLLEQECRRRAVEGFDKPVFQGGKQVGIERVYSDMLLAFLIRGRRPETFGGNFARTPAKVVTIVGGLPDGAEATRAFER
jgi:hypothetical protein